MLQEAIVNLWTGRYMVAESEDALYVAFMGTKQLRDIWTNARLGMTSLWPDQAGCYQDEVICV